MLDTKYEPMISFHDFKKIELRIGTITAAEPIEDADKLYKLSVDVGEDNPRTIVAGIRPHYEEPEDVVGLQVAVVANMEPKEMFGVESQGMVLAASNEEEFTLLSPLEEIENGSTIR